MNSTTHLHKEKANGYIPKSKERERVMEESLRSSSQELVPPNEELKLLKDPGYSFSRAPRKVGFNIKQPKVNTFIR